MGVGVTTRTVYSVQHWVDADGIRDGWCTGYGYYMRSLKDAQTQLDHDRASYPDMTFRIARAEITEWEEVRDEHR